MIYQTITSTVHKSSIPRKTYLWDPSETNATRVLTMSLFDATGSYEEDLYYTHDAQKNSIALFGIKAGRRALYQYGAYGNLIKIDGEIASHNPFRFSCEYHDDELALIYYNYRSYNPTDGRWINRDPIEEQGGVNLYGFVKNNSLLHADYLGQKECNEDTLFHYQNMKYEMTITTAIGNTITVSDPLSTIRDALRASLSSEMQEQIAKNEGLTKYLKTVTSTTKRFEKILIVSEAISSAAFTIDQLKVSLEADYCCLSCTNGKEQYQWQSAKAEAHESGLLISIKDKVLITKFPQALMKVMQVAGEQLIDNACTDQV